VASQANRPAAISPFTSGPLMAIQNSSHPFGMRSGRETPPIGYMTISVVRMPYWRATSVCPNSCSRTEANSATMYSAVMAPDCRSPTPMNSRKISSRTNVKWKRTGTPKTRRTPSVPELGAGFGFSSDGVASGML
jgi:hypothetical protein